MSDQKPCEMPCCKCGSLDIYRHHHRKNDKWNTTFGFSFAEETELISYAMCSAVAKVNCIVHHCRVCQFEWATLPLDAVPKPPMKITKWIRDGIHGLSHVKDTAQLYEEASNALNGACSWDIMGTVVFEAEDGKTYVGNVEFDIGLINPDYLKQLQDEDKENEEPVSRGSGEEDCAL